VLKNNGDLENNEVTVHRNGFVRIQDGRGD
jgi:hypothetical protein